MKIQSEKTCKFVSCNNDFWVEFTVQHLRGYLKFVCFNLYKIFRQFLYFALKIKKTHIIIFLQKVFIFFCYWKSLYYVHISNLFFAMPDTECSVAVRLITCYIRYVLWQFIESWYSNLVNGNKNCIQASSGIHINGTNTM